MASRPSKLFQRRQKVTSRLNNEKDDDRVHDEGEYDPDS